MVFANCCMFVYLAGYYYLWRNAIVNRRAAAAGYLVCPGRKWHFTATDLPVFITGDESCCVGAIQKQPLAERAWLAGVAGKSAIKWPQPGTGVCVTLINSTRHADVGPEPAAG